MQQYLGSYSPFHVVYRHGTRAFRRKKTGWTMNKKFDMIWERLVLSTRIGALHSLRFPTTGHDHVATDVTSRCLPRDFFLRTLDLFFPGTVMMPIKLSRSPSWTRYCGCWLAWRSKSKLNDNFCRSVLMDQSSKWDSYMTPLGPVDEVDFRGDGDDAPLPYAETDTVDAL
jgi:hypothetical protein